MTSRKQASAKTAISAVILQLIATIFGFVNQKFFIDALGVEYSGISGTFGNVLSILTLSDLGVSASVIFHLYGAIAKKDDKKIAALMTFYKKACWVITGIIFFGGLMILPFSKNFIGETTVTDNIYIIFLLCIITASFQYAFNYRRILLSADQKGYVINSVMCITTTMLYIAKIIVLKTTGNFYIYLTCAIVEKIIENIILNIITKKRYKNAEEKVKLDSETAKDIKKKMYASAYHNSASYIVNFTDNIIISMLFGVAQVGFYNNYYIIINAVNVLVAQMLNSVTASLGNILASEGAKKLYEIFKSLFMANFWLYSIICLALYYCFTPFISMWLGSEFLLSNVIVATIILNLFVAGMRNSANNILIAGGIIYENRFVPVVEAIINLVTSILLAKIFGIAGVFMGTILSNLFLHLYSYPKYAFKKILNRNATEYIFLFVRYLAVFLLTWIGIDFIMHFIIIENNLLAFITKGLICVAVPSIIYLILFSKTKELKYFLDILKNITKKLRKR